MTENLLCMFSKPNFNVMLHKLLHKNKFKKENVMRKNFETIYLKLSFRENDVNILRGNVGKTLKAKIGKM